MKGISSFVAFTVMLAISTALAISMYILTSNTYALHRPLPRYVRGYVVCYNVTGHSIAIGGGISVCRGGEARYLCVFRSPAPLNVTVVYSNSADNIYVDEMCVALLGDLPKYAYSRGNDVYAVFEVKLYDPWTE